MVALKSGNELPPPQPLLDSFRPPNSLPHRVSTGENWQTLGARYKVDPRQLILQNFQTDKAEYVNWYLHHRLKCDTTTPDRYNWVFSSSARHNGGPHAGTVHITPLWYAIVDAAQVLTRRWFAGIVNGSLLKPTLFGATRLITLRDTDFQWDITTGLVEFRNSLGWQGATDELAAAWAEALAASFRDLFQSVDVRLPVDASRFPVPPVGTVVPVMTMLPAWAPVDGENAKGKFTRYQSTIVQQLDRHTDSPMRSALTTFRQWWDRELPTLCDRVRFRAVLLQGQYDHAHNVFTGSAFGQRGCLELQREGRPGG